MLAPMNGVLSQAQKPQFEQQHRSCRDKRVCERMKGILLAAEGWTVFMISQALSIHEMMVHQHITDNLKSKQLKPQNGGSQRYFSAEQTELLIVL